jgi:hypothetical protein
MKTMIATLALVLLAPVPTFAIVRHRENDADQREQGRRRDGKQSRALCAQLRHGRTTDL